MKRLRRALWMGAVRELPLPRARNRISAYLYGNILVLAATVAATDDSIRHWDALIIVTATTLTTYLAHVVAHGIGQQLGRSDEDSRLHLAQEFSDAVPILVSGLLPGVVLVLAGLGVLPPPLAQVLAGLFSIGRIAWTGMAVKHSAEERMSPVVLWTGLGLAGLSLVIVALKVLFTH